MLREAEVVRRNDSTYLGNFEHIAEQILKARDIREENIHSLEEWIRKIPGAWIKKIQQQDTASSTHVYKKYQPLFL